MLSHIVTFLLCFPTIYGQYKYSQGKVVTDNSVIKTISSDNEISCIRQCRRYPGCKAVFFSPYTCQLLEQSAACTAGTHQGYILGMLELMQYYYIILYYIITIFSNDFE